MDRLQKKSPKYKDAAQLLKNAKKQEQLGELYFEARKLHDGKKRQAVLRVFDELVRRGKTVLMVTHDRDVAAHGSRMLILSDGEIVNPAKGRRRV